MDNHPRVRRRPADVKVHIRRTNNILILSDRKGERKANAMPHVDKIR